MMAIEARNELARAASARYIRAVKDQGSILSEFCGNSGLSRKHALRLLRRPPGPPTRRTRNRPRKYGLAEQDALRRLWPFLGYPSAKRTVAGLADLMDALDRHGEWVLDPKLRANLRAPAENEQRIRGEWEAKVEIRMSPNHVPGERMWIDWAGQAAPLTDPDTGKIARVPVFVAAFGVSQKLFAKAFPSQELAHWLGAQVAAFKFGGGD